MKRTARLLTLCLGTLALACCFDLDTFIYPIVFKPTVRDTFEFGAATGTDEGDHINPLYPDSIVTDTGSVTPVSFDSEGNTLWAYYLAHTAAPNKIVLYCHGNSGYLDNFWPRAKLLYAAGYDVFLFDYRGFGRSSGTTSEASFRTDAEQALAYVTATLGYAPTEVLLYGYSLGTVAAVHLAAHGEGMENALGLILESPVGSTDIFVQDAVGLSLPARYLTRFELDNITNIQSVYIPLLWLGGTEDELTRNDTHGQAVYDNCPAPVKYKKIVKGVGHGGAPYGMDPTFALYVEGMRRFGNGEDPFP